MGPSRSRLLFAGAFALVPIAVACNAIVGLDDYKRTECGAFPCPYDGGFDAPDGFVPDGGIDAQTDAPPGVGPTTWAAFVMPNYKEDAGLTAPNPLSYAISGEEVEDKVTGLVWRKAVVGKPPFGDQLTEASAEAACKQITPGSWRLPKRIELVTLLSYNQGAPYVDKTVFTGVPADVAWTSSEVRTASGAVPNKYWAIDFKTGALTQLDGTTEPAKALCVKGK